MYKSFNTEWRKKKDFFYLILLQTKPLCIFFSKRVDTNKIVSLSKIERDEKKKKIPRSKQR